jgi:hypothetical protein
MPGVFELRYRDGRAEQLWGIRGFYYVLGADLLLCFLPTPAWCHNCAGHCHAEDLEDVETLKSKLKQLDDPQSEWYRTQPRPTADLVAHSRQHYQNQLRLWEQRTSPPRCVNCGKTEVSFFVENEWSPHPHSAEEVRFVCIGMGSTSFAMKFFNPDGVELTLTPEERKHYLELINAGRCLW